MAKKILIVDDESLARDRLQRFLKTYPESLEIAQAENGAEALEQIKQIQPDVVFLDIQMPGLTGFEVLYQLENRNFQVIFQTAYDEFAIKAFEVNACDYLLKPYPEEKLHQSLKKALVAQDQKEKLQNLEKHLEQSKNYLKNLAVKVGSKTQILGVENISHFKSEDHYTFACLDGVEFILDISLSWLEERLDPAKFVRCHRSNIVNLSFVERISGVDDSQVSLKSGLSLPLSRGHRKDLLKHFS